jgi:SAM-dependent methyltransferase
MKYPRFISDFITFRHLSTASRARLPVRMQDIHPQLLDDTAKTAFDRHYVYHTAWSARVIHTLKPHLHVDIGSSLYFVGTVSAFVPVAFYDYRPADLHLSQLECRHADLLSLPFADHSLASVSCMHVVEHVGLGRYGDPLDPHGDMKAMTELQRVVAPSGSLLFVVPVGTPRVCFDAHRIYSFEMIQEAFPELELVDFSLIPDDPAKGLIANADPSLVANQSYGCGCFWFRRRPST